MNKSKFKTKVITTTIITVVSLLAIIGSTYYIRSIKESTPSTRVESYMNNILPKTPKTHLAKEQYKDGEVEETIKRIDDVLIGIDKANLQTSPGANQLYLFLQKPWDLRYLYIAFFACLTLFLVYLSRKGLRRFPRITWYWLSFLIVLLAFVDLSVPLKHTTKDHIDVFFVFICFLTVIISIIAIIHLYRRLLNDKFNSSIQLERREHRQNTLLWAAITGWSLAYLCFFIGMYTAGAQKSALTAILRPAFSACKMFFLADSPSDLATALRLNGAFMGFYTIVKIIVLVVTTSTLVSLVLYRWKAYWETSIEKAKDKKLYIFFGITRAARLMAKNIREQDDEQDSIILFIENRKENASIFNSVSFSGILGMFRHRGEAYDVADEVNAHLIISNVMMSSAESRELINSADANDIIRDLGLKHCFRMIKEAAEVHAFFLYDEQHININGSMNLRALLNKVYNTEERKDAIKIHCWTRQSTKSQILEVPDENIKEDCTEINILDSSRLSVQLLMQKPSYHPVRFVDVDTETATVKNRFEALILGFGETGQDALKFLYEFGAFLHHDCASNFTEETAKNAITVRSPFHCDVVDGNMDVIMREFLHNTPAITNSFNAIQDKNGKWIPDLNDPLISFHQAKFNSQDYINLIEDRIKKVNYIVLALGSDELNISALNDLMETAVKTRKKGELGTLKIFVRSYLHNNYETMKQLEYYYNNLDFGDTKSEHVIVFGQEQELFTKDIIIKDNIVADAKKYYKQYEELRTKKSQEGEKIWNNRHQKGKTLSWENRKKVKRQEQQDINNDLHAKTKLRLVSEKESPDTTLFKKLSDTIIYENEDKEVLFEQQNKAEAKLCINLARTEHLRWNASHEMMGYLPNDDTGCNEFDKTHNCLVDWQDLPIVTKNHNDNEIKKVRESENKKESPIYNPYYADYQTYDYLVVKTTFDLESQNYQIIEDK